MKIVVDVSREDMRHLLDHSFLDDCATVQKIMIKVQKQCSNILNGIYKEAKKKK